MRRANKMTQLRKALRRETDAQYRGTNLIIQIEPPSIIKIKEKGRRTWYETSVEAVFVFAAKRHAEKIRQEKAEARKIRRATR